MSGSQNSSLMEGARETALGCENQLERLSYRLLGYDLKSPLSRYG